jgi:hypothetical protein
MTIEERLPCGTRLDELLSQVAEDEPAANPPHQASCPYCQAALRRLERHWGAVRALAQAPVRVPEGLTARIMARVQALAEQVSDSVLLGARRGETRVGHAAIRRYVQRLAAGVPGVALASVQLQPPDTAQPHRVDIALRLVIAFGPPVARVANAVREILARRVPRFTGAELGQVGITIADVAEP